MVFDFVLLLFIIVLLLLALKLGVINCWCEDCFLYKIQEWLKNK